MDLNIAPAMALNAVESSDGDDFIGKSSLAVNAQDVRPEQRNVSGGHPVMGAQLAAGDSLDLTAAPSARGGTHDYTGAVVVAFLLRASAGNSGAVTIGPGASNGYDVGQYELAPGQALVTDGVDGPTVAAGVKTLDTSGDPGDLINVVMILEE